MPNLKNGPFALPFISPCDIILSNSFTNEPYFKNGPGTSTVKRKVMVTETLKTLFKRDLGRLKNEIELYPDEKTIWLIDKDIANSAGNLCLHLVGNLNTYIGAELGKTGYIRYRELEFSSKNIPKEELVKKVEATIAMVETTLDQLTLAQMEAEYPILVFETKTTTEYLLIHLATHLTYHLGQINYHRRLLGV